MKVHRLAKTKRQTNIFEYLSKHFQTMAVFRITMVKFYTEISSTIFSLCCNMCLIVIKDLTVIPKCEFHHLLL